MTQLRHDLERPERRRRAVAGLCDVVHARVAAERGLGGGALRLGLGVLERIRPDAVAVAIDKLLPEFADALAPWDPAGASGPEARARGLGAALCAAPDQVAAALLGVTDRRVDGASGPVRRAYGGLRAGAQARVAAAVPELARLLETLLTAEA